MLVKKTFQVLLSEKIKQTIFQVSYLSSIWFHLPNLLVFILLVVIWSGTDILQDVIHTEVRELIKEQFRITNFTQLLYTLPLEYLQRYLMQLCDTGHRNVALYFHSAEQKINTCWLLLITMVFVRLSYHLCFIRLIIINSVKKYYESSLHNTRLSNARIRLIYFSHSIQRKMKTCNMSRIY